MSLRNKVILSLVNTLIALSFSLKPVLALASEKESFDTEIEEFLHTFDVIERKGLRIESHGIDHDLVIFSTRDKSPKEFKKETCETARDQYLIGRIEDYTFGPGGIVGSPGFIAKNIEYSQNKMTISGLSCNPEEDTSYQCCPKIPDTLEAEFIDAELIFTKLPITHFAESIDEIIDSDTRAESEPNFEVSTYGGTTRVLTHGTFVWGNQFGLNLESNNCSGNRLWLSITSYEDELESLVGKTVNFEWGVGGDFLSMALDVTEVIDITSEIKIVLFNGMKLQQDLVNLLRESDWLSVKITGPGKFIDKFFIPEELFYVKNFSDHYDQALNICKNIEIN